ncbi:MAG: MFS transporter [Velocimicrobium sp.]
MKKLSASKMWLFAVGQLGWSLLSGVISSWLVYFYQPDLATKGSVKTVFIPQGLAILGIITIIGAIAALGRIFDAVTDPWIASLSDRCKSKNGRRIPFLKWSALPLAASTVLVFCAPVNGTSWFNALWLFVFVILYYISITAYCTPYNALIAELGHTSKERLNISTVISLTFFLGTALGYQASAIWKIFEPSMGRVAAVRVTFLIFAVIAYLCMMVPVVAIKEKEYVIAKPSEGSAVSSLVSTFKNKNFRVFVASDILYWIALTMFQTGLVFFVTSLLGLDTAMSGVYFIIMSVLSVVFYMPVNIISRKVGKKILVLFAFALFSIAYLFTSFFGTFMGITPVMQGYILVVLAALPMAIFGILPNAIVADIAESDAKISGQNREGMFYAARTFAFKMGQSIAMLIFTAVATIGMGNGRGYRLVAIIACIFCVLGGVVLFFYDEKSVDDILKKDKLS